MRAVVTFEEWDLDVDALEDGVATRRPEDDALKRRDLIGLDDAGNLPEHRRGSGGKLRESHELRARGALRVHGGTGVAALGIELLAKLEDELLLAQRVVVGDEELRWVGAGTSDERLCRLSDVRCVALWGA